MSGIDAISTAARPSIQGLSNFRDFGGLPAASGRRVMPGRLYRSEHLGGLTAAGVDVLAAYGIRTIVDLRGTAERVLKLPAALPPGAEIVSTPVEPHSTPRLRQLLADPAATDAAVRAVMIETYRRFVAAEAESFGAAIDILVRAADAPVLVHCTAGKDRTGFLAAVLLDALGVDRDRIVADYVATNELWDRASISGHLPAGSHVIEQVLVADPEYLDSAFEEVRRTDGDSRAFLRRATRGRVDDDTLKSLLETETAQ